MALMGIATYLSGYPILLVAFLFLIERARGRSDVRRTVAMGLFSYVWSVGGLLYLSFLTTSSWRFLEATYGAMYVYRL